MASNLLIIDTRLVAYYLFHRHMDWLGITRLIAKHMLKTKFDFKSIVFVMDKGKSKRVEKAPEYKAHREELIKKKGVKYEKKITEFNRFYSKLEIYLRNYGRVVAIQGLEADDLASVITSIVSVDNLIYFTSDIDWIKFINENNPKIGNHYIYHLNRAKLIHQSEVKKEFGYSYGISKVIEDSFCGVTKENISGIKGLGHKTYEKLMQQADYNISEFKRLLYEKIESGKLKLPDKFNTIEEMFEYNYELFKPLSFKDLTDDEKAEFKKQFEVKPTRDYTKIIADSVNLFGKIYIPENDEIKFYKLGNIS